MNRNTFTRRSLFSGAAFVLVFALLAGFPANLNKRMIDTSTVAAAPTSMSYVDFITGAYQGAYGRNPTCEESQAAYDALAYGAANNDLLGAARRFVATLFETPNSYDNVTGYDQTDEYDALNPQGSTDTSHQELFVTDLYQAFLLRNPDSSGFTFWMGALSSGRQAVLNGFIACGEFEDLVATLYAGSRPYCPPCSGMTCSGGEHLDVDTCICVPNCEGANGGHFNELCQ